jgi:hypothetical protein
MPRHPVLGIKGSKPRISSMLKEEAAKKRKSKPETERKSAKSGSKSAKQAAAAPG